MNEKRLAALGLLFLVGCSSGGTGGTGGGTAETGGGTGSTGGGTGGSTGSDAGFPPLQYAFRNHTFAFENYTNGPGITNLTPVEVRRMLGDGACSGSISGDTCDLTPNAERWMNATNASMNGGHCEGMAVLSALFAAGLVRPQDFGGDTAFALALAGNTRLQREIAYWWATQTVQPTSSSELRGPTNGLTPTEVVDRVRQMFMQGGEIYTFGLYKRDGTGGHANNPLSVEERSGKLFVKAYENNFPNTDMLEYEIDPAANTWRYVATTNPNEPASTYDGDATTRSLTLTPLSRRLGQQTCATCGSVVADGTTRGAAVSYREIILNGDGHVLITDPQGKRLGFDGAQFFNEIPGATEAPVKRETKTWGLALDPIYRLPLGTPLTVTLDGTRQTAPSRSGVTLSAPGYAFSVEGVNVDPNQKDTITFSAGTEAVSYKTTSTETPTVALAVTFDGADYLFELNSAAETGGVEVTLTLQAATGRLKVDVNAADGNATYDIRIERRDTESTVVFTHAGNTLASAAVVQFLYGDWAGNGSPMSVEVDSNSDGTVDSTVMVSDDP